MSSKPKRKFSFKSLRFRSKDHSDADSGKSDLRRSMSEPTDAQRSETTESLAPPLNPRSQTDVAPSSNGRLVSGVQSPPSSFRMPTPAPVPVPSEAGTAPRLPVPEVPSDIETVQMLEPVQLPTPSASGELNILTEPHPSVTGTGTDKHAPSPLTEAQANATDVLAGLTNLALKVEAGDPLSQRANGTAKALDSVGDKVDTLTDKASKLQQAVQPVVAAVKATGAIDIIQKGLSSFGEDLPWLMKSLDEVAKIHPFVTVVVLAFKAVYTMDMTRRENDKRITALYVSMKDMIEVLVQLRHVKDVHEVGPGGMTVEARVQALSEQTARDLKECANVCDTYTKKRLLVRVLKGQIWDAKLVEWIGKFTSRKAEFEFALSVHTARAVDSMGNIVNEIDVKLDDLTAKLLHMFAQLAPPVEVELGRRISMRGGVKRVMEDDLLLREFMDEDSDHDDRGHIDVGGRDAKQGSALQSKPRSTYTLNDLKSELREDSDMAIRKNFEIFQGKFALQQRQLEEELTKAIREGNERIIDAVNAGPHDLIKHPDLRAIWKEMGWRRNVKARLFVLTLRDHFSETPAWPSMAVVAANADNEPTARHNPDEWALDYISITYIQQIMEAFDDDGSGYITVSEVNRFTDAIPSGVDWTLPHWIAYWAIGWQQAATAYCHKIVEIFAHMHTMRDTVLPENRYWVEYYLNKVWRHGYTFSCSLQLPGALPDWLEAKFAAYQSYEEDRIRQNLRDIRYDIDALNTVYIVARPAKIEKAFYPLLYLLLARDIEIFEAAKTTVLNQEELWDSAESILYVYDAMFGRANDLQALFRHQKLDVAQQFKVFSCELFDYVNDDTPLFGMESLATQTFGLEPKEDPPVGRWSTDLPLLNYPADEAWPFQCEVYENDAEDALNEADTQVSMPLRSLLGQWSGFIYIDDVYPINTMMSFFAQASTETGKFEASGFSHGTTVTYTGSCEQDSDGIVSVLFTAQYAQGFNTEYFSGHVLADGSITGTQGWDDDFSQHRFNFFLRRIPDDILCYRAPIHEFQQSKPKALWKFATEAVQAQVRKRMWSWSYFADRRDRRKAWMDGQLRLFHYGPTLSWEETLSRERGLQHMTMRDSSMAQTRLDYLLRILPKYHGLSCDNCDKAIGGARLFCLNCQPSKGRFTNTVDFCDNPDCYGAVVTTTKRSDLERPHVPEHVLVKIRTVVQDGELPDFDRRAKQALEACRTLFEATLDGPAGKGATSNELLTSHEQVEIVQKSQVLAAKSGESLTEDRTSLPDGERPDEALAEDSAQGGQSTEAAVNTPPGVSSKEDHVEDEAAPECFQCSVCHEQVGRPCWFCIDCYTRDINFLICDTCEKRKLLRCTNPDCFGDKTYVQPHWYYGHRQDDNFMCGHCNWRRVLPPDLDRHNEHTYLHALLRCKLEWKPEEGNEAEARMIELEGKVNELDNKVNALDSKVSRLEDYLVRMESTLKLLLSNSGPRSAVSMS